MTEWPRLLCAAVLLAAGSTAAVAQTPDAARAPESCAALAQFGAYDTRASITDIERAESFRNWLCQANIALESDLRLAAAALGIAADVFETKFGFDPASGEDFLDWKHGVCASVHAERHASDQLFDFVKAITPAASKALALCDAPPGLHARLEATAKPCDFLIRLGWTPVQDVAAPKDVQVIATNAHVVCQPAGLETPFAVAGPTDLMCTRHDDTAMVVMVAAPSVRVSRLDHLMELPQALADPQDLLGGEYQVDIAWRDRGGRFAPPTTDTWKLDLTTGFCRVTGSGTAYSPRSAWFNQSSATCSPTQITFTGYRTFDPLTHKPSQFTLTLRSEDNGASFVGGGSDSAGNVAVQATVRHKGPQPPPDEVVCGP